jgi:hypothetical protein
VVCAVLFISCVVLQENHGLRVCVSRVKGDEFGSVGKGVSEDC